VKIHKSGKCTSVSDKFGAAGKINAKIFVRLTGIKKVPTFLKGLLVPVVFHKKSLDFSIIYFVFLTIWQQESLEKEKQN
jgi:hypothetical protein